jgi:N-acetylglucosaminyldiphosphoundecaprenol N-acetyl-beta-D-mannosaminyltransferase
MGFSIDSVDEAGAVATVVGALEEGRGGSAITMNLEILRRFTREEDLEPLFEDADLVVADGMPLVWASRIKGTPLPERVAGSDLVWSLTAEAGLKGRRVFLLGGAPGACHEAEAALRNFYPGLEVSGCYAPPYGFERDPAAIREIRELLADAQPDLVYVALGFPKQEQLIAQLRPELPGAWFIGVGVSLSFLGGQVERAPDWVARLGLEWLHRLVQEPRRLFKRYLVHGIPFALRLLVYALACRILGRDLASPRCNRRAAPTRVSERVVFHRGAVERRRAKDLAELILR